ncbi:MAG: S-layer homology domain-containing protein, partial [Acidobacteria bacterium]|nr:S-layer homology domain-containing protein [Acidobacteriota bacterium]
KVYDAAGNLAGESNSLNAPGLTGRHENVVVRNPGPQTFKMVTANSFGAGTSQNVYGTVEATEVRLRATGDLAALPADQAAAAEKTILSSIMLAPGTRFLPSSPVSRAEFAGVLVRSGAVAQYMTANPAFADVRDQTTRNAVESVQCGSSGRLFYDASTSGYFYPNENATRLAAAIAMVKAAGLESSATSAVLPLSVSDAAAIPTQWRGYAAVALQNGFLSLDGNGAFAPARAITRIETASAFARLIGN